MDLHDADRFTFTLPVWTVAVRKRVDRTLGERSPRFATPAGTDFAVLFTDDDLATRFIVDSSLSSACESVAVTTETELVDWLETMARRGAPNVAIDPPVGTSVRFLCPAIADVLASIRLQSACRADESPLSFRLRPTTDRTGHGVVSGDAR